MAKVSRKSEYTEFLEKKIRVHEDSGIEVEESKLSSKLFPFQKRIVRWALAKGRAAIFAGCGLGKTIMQLEWARHIEGAGRQMGFNFEMTA